MKKLTATKAIRAKCIQCCCGSLKEVKLCASTHCALWHFRLGHAPKEPVDATTLTVFSDGTGQIYSERAKKGSGVIDDEDDDDETELVEHRKYPDPWNNEE